MSDYRTAEVDAQEQTRTAGAPRYTRSRTNSRPLDLQQARAAHQCGNPQCECHRDSGNVHCPAHDDTHPSLSINESGGKLLYKCHAGCSQELLTEAIKHSSGPATGTSTNGTSNGTRSHKTIYPYHSAAGELVFEVVRTDFPNGEKKFAQRQPDGAGGWIYNLKGITTVLYNLPDVTAAATVIICEGEKAADAVNLELKVAGLYGLIVATSGPMGAGKWKPHYSDALQNKNAIILPDNDAPGREHAAQVAASLDGKVNSLKVIELPELPEKGDAVDYFVSVGTIGDLLDLAETVPEAPHAPQRFRLISIPELMTRPDPTWRIHGILQDATNSVIAAPHASFKSFLVLDMSLHVAFGLPWCGRDVKQGEVVYVCAEGASGMKARIKAWCFDRELEWPAAFHFVEDAVQIHNEDDLNAFIVAIGDIKPALIIFDTLSLCALGLDENSNRDMNMVMADVKRLQDATGAHVMLVHHASKAGGIRGASSIPAAVQSEFELKRERDTVTFTCLKQKDGPQFKPMVFTARSVEYDTWYRKSSLVLDFEGKSDDASRLTAIETKVYELLLDTFGAAGATKTAWHSVAEENKIVKQSFYRAVTQLVEKGRVDDGHDGKGGRGAIYRPVELMKSEESQSENETNSDNITLENTESLEVSESLKTENETKKTPRKQKVSKSHTPLGSETKETFVETQEKETADSEPDADFDPGEDAY